MTALKEAGWTIAEPDGVETYDLVAKSPRTGVWVQMQVKTVRVRDDRGKSPLVIYGTKNNGKPYTPDECQYFVGVHGDDCYLILNRGIVEYWKPADNTKINPQKKSAWILLDGENTNYKPWEEQ